MVQLLPGAGQCWWIWGLRTSNQPDTCPHFSHFPSPQVPGIFLVSTLGLEAPKSDGRWLSFIGLVTMVAGVPKVERGGHKPGPRVLTPRGDFVWWMWRLVCLLVFAFNWDDLS